MKFELEWDDQFDLEAVSVQYVKDRKGVKHVEYYRTYFRLRDKEYSTFLGLTGASPQEAADKTCAAILANSLARENETGYNKPVIDLNLDFLKGDQE